MITEIKNDCIEFKIRVWKANAVFQLMGLPALHYNLFCNPPRQKAGPDYKKGFPLQSGLGPIPLGI